MKSFIAATLTAALASAVSAQQASSGCDENYSGTFEIAPYNITANIPSQGSTVCNSNPIATLQNGVLTDQNKRTGEVVANHQFQFDNPVQGPTTSGFCIYNNGSLALNGNAIWYGCASGGFSNLYDQSQGGQCYQIYIVTYPCTGSAGPVGGSASIASSSSSTSSSSTSTLVTSATPVAASTPATSSTALATIPTVAPVPFPAGNSTTPAATASKVTTTSSSSSSTSSTTATPTTFKGAANVVAVGSKVAAVVAGIAAFALA